VFSFFRYFLLKIVFCCKKLKKITELEIDTFNIQYTYSLFSRATLLTCYIVDDVPDILIVY